MQVNLRFHLSSETIEKEKSFKQGKLAPLMRATEEFQTGKDELFCRSQPAFSFPYAVVGRGLTLKRLVDIRSSSKTHVKYAMRVKVLHPYESSFTYFSCDGFMTGLELGKHIEQA